jgi:hypothetical protein
MTPHRRSTGKQGHLLADRLAAEIADALQAQDTRNASAPRDVTWTRAQLRKRIQQARAAPVLAAEPAHRQMPEPDHVPPADREAEP